MNGGPSSSSSVDRLCAESGLLNGSWVCQEFLGGDFLACAEPVDTPSYRISFAELDLKSIPLLYSCLFQKLKRGKIFASSIEGGVGFLKSRVLHIPQRNSLADARTSMAMRDAGICD